MKYTNECIKYITPGDRGGYRRASQSNEVTKSDQRVTFVAQYGSSTGVVTTGTYKPVTRDVMVNRECVISNRRDNGKYGRRYGSGK
jgi:hypothetical protein